MVCCLFVTVFKLALQFEYLFVSFHAHFTQKSNKTSINYNMLFSKKVKETICSMLLYDIYIHKAGYTLTSYSV